ncbi:ParA family protein [Acidobacteriota bacterium]
MTIIAFYNIKGGVGKTSTAVNISYLSSRENLRTLLIDLDPQGSASFYFRIRPRKNFKTNKFLQGGQSIENNIRGTDYPHLDLLPSHISFGKLDIGLHKFKQSKSRLKTILQPIRREYDVIVMDCPPNITLLSENVFRAADAVIVPTIPTPLSIMTYKKLMKFFKRQQLDDSKIFTFFSMVEQRKTIHKESVQTIGKKDPHFLKSTIPYSAEVEKMGVYREPLFRYSPRSFAAIAYEGLWQEINSRILKS